LSNLPLDKKSKYNHKKRETITNTKASEILPMKNILVNSTTEKLDCVMG
jgi:hypothetical protein